MANGGHQRKKNYSDMMVDSTIPIVYLRALRLACVARGGVVVCRAHPSVAPTVLVPCKWWGFVMSATNWYIQLTFSFAPFPLKLTTIILSNVGNEEKNKPDLQLHNIRKREKRTKSLFASSPTKRELGLVSVPDGVRSIRSYHHVTHSSPLSFSFILFSFFPQGNDD